MDDCITRQVYYGDGARQTQEGTDVAADFKATVAKRKSGVCLDEIAVMILVV